MRVFLDTNVLVSAAATRGLCADVVRHILKSHQLEISESLLGELRQTLRQKIGVPDRLAVEFIEMLQQDSNLASPGTLEGIPAGDKPDAEMLSSALNGKADYFITGDRELLLVGRTGELQIISPRKFWEVLREQP